MSALAAPLTLSLSRKSERVLSPVDKLPSFGRKQQRRRPCPGRPRGSERERGRTGSKHRR